MAIGSVQPSPPHPSPPQQQYTSPPVTVILTIILLLFFFVCFFSIYFCRCFMQNIVYTWHLRHSPTGSPLAGQTNNARGGLDPSIIQSYPTFNYSSVKGYRREKYGLECAICLVEFKDSDILRLLMPCCHVFHQECIDLWLESHKTCPVCRRNLDSPIQSPVKFDHLYDDRETSGSHPHESREDSFSITINDDDHESRDNGKGERVALDQRQIDDEVGNVYRSHSTGHSIVKNKDEEEEEDRFTLRLPEHVKSNIIKGHHCSSKSWTTFGEYKTRSKTSVIGLSSGDTNKV